MKREKLKNARWNKLVNALLLWKNGVMNLKYVINVQNETVCVCLINAQTIAVALLLQNVIIKDGITPTIKAIKSY